MLQIKLAEQICKGAVIVCSSKYAASLSISVVIERAQVLQRCSVAELVLILQTKKHPLDEI